MNWRRSVLGLAVAIPIILLLGYGMTRDPREIHSPLPGRPAPAFDLEYMDTDGRASLEDFEGQVVVLNFWASWCLECRYEHRDLSEAATLYDSHGVQFLGVLYNDTPENGRRWIDVMGGQNYPALKDAGSATAIDYGLWGVPETLVIDQKGMVVYKHIGPITLTQLRTVIDPLLAGNATQ